MTFTLHILLEQHVINTSERFADQVNTLDVRCLQCNYKGPLSTLALHSCEHQNSVDILEPEISSESLDIMNSTPTHAGNTQRTEIETQTSTILQVARTPISSNMSSNEHPSILETLHRSISSLLSKDEEKVHTHLTKRKLNFASDKAAIRCKTRGQPILMKRLTKPRKASENAKSPLKRRRAKEVAKICSLVAGPGISCNQKQHISELKIVSKRSCIEIYAVQTQSTGTKTKYL